MEAVATSKADAISASLTVTPLSTVCEHAFEIYGFIGSTKRLSSERDETFLFTRSDGAEFTLKIANAAEDPAALEFQDGALLHLAKVAPHVPVPRLVPTRDGRESQTLQTVDGPRIMRLLTYLGGDLQYRTPTTAEQSRNIGMALAQLGLGLKDYGGRPPSGKLMWDISHTLDLQGFTDFVGEERREAVEVVLVDFEAALPAIRALKRRQIIHNDFNPHNILMQPYAPCEVSGIIDFGDMVEAPLINDVAVALSYHLATDNWQERTQAFLEGFIAVRPLEADEIELLPLLARCRLAMSIIIAEWRSALFPDNRDYIMRNHAYAWRSLQHIPQLTSAGLKSLAPNLSRA
ncbi:phosphotransferase enzyme family protein [Agrobacterium larrymoorei]|nr:phosphotransferase enzyme family protein [Agrobacterium larrymoorei]